MGIKLGNTGSNTDQQLWKLHSSNQCLHTLTDIDGDLSSTTEIRCAKLQPKVLCLQYLSSLDVLFIVLLIYKLYYM